MRKSYTYKCDRCSHLYSWVPETDDEKPQRCMITIPTGKGDERRPCGGHGEKVT